MIGKIGDIIEWDFKDERFQDFPDFLKNKTFTAEIAWVNIEEKDYGVNAEYGQDLIAFEQCRIINII